VTDYSGSVAQDELHYPWGQQWQLAGSQVEERFARLGLRDAETSFDPTRYRMYGSNLGRWLSPDPVLGCVMHPENFNRYNYVGNNPANWTDPQGTALLTCPQAQALCQIGAIYCEYFVDNIFFPRCVGECFDAYSACLGDPLVISGTIPLRSA
jgi:RHS repeat-associated protein